MRHLMLRCKNMKYVNKPNLPQGRVTLAAVSCEAGEAISKLNSLGVEIIKINRNLNLPVPVNSHPDIQMLHTGNKEIFCYEHLFLGESTNNFYFKEIREKAGNLYPDDVRLNCSLIGNKLICNTKTVAREILEYAYSNDLTIINVNQGYARCSICIVDENTIITDDKSIFSAAGKFFNDAQFISKGSIGLKGYCYGFIGGCCGKIDKNIIAFNGAIESHKDYKIIIDCLNRNGVECLELHREPLYDIGGIIPLCEKST